MSINITNCFLLLQRLIDECVWKEYKSDTGRPYFHNNDTKESKWVIPEELEKLKGNSDVSRVSLGLQLVSKIISFFSVTLHSNNHFEFG